MARLTAADGVVLARSPDAQTAQPIRSLRGVLPNGPLAVSGWQPGAVQQRRNSGDVLVLFFNAGSRTWWAAGYLDEKRAAWLDQALTWTAPNAPSTADPKRLQFFASHLEDPQPLIAQAAYEEISVQPYAVLRTVARGLDAQRIGAWTRQADAVERRPLYWLLWGFQGGAAAAATARQAARPDAASASRRTSAELSAQVAALLEVTGAEGSEWVRQNYLTDPTVTDADVQAVLLALSTLGNEGVRVSRDGLATVYADYIRSNPHRAGFVAPDLAAWGRWDFAEAFAAAMRSEQPQVFSSRYAMVFYLLRNPRPEARALLDALKAEKRI